jgi:hypothetical protein
MSWIRSSRAAQLLLGLVGLVLTVLLFFPGLVVEYLWMGELGFEGVYWTILSTQTILFVSVLAVASAYFGANFYWLIQQIPPMWASRWSQGGEAPQVGGEPITRDRLRRLAYVAAGILSLLFASGFAGQWDGILRWWYAGSYGISDPIYGTDVGFYMLELPFIQSLQSGFVGLVFLGLLALVTGYVVTGEIGIENGQFRVRGDALRHLGVNVILLLLGWTWGFYLDRYELLQEGGGAVFGAGYTDVNVTLPALWVMMAATLGLAALVALNLVRKRIRVLGLGVVLYVATLVVSLVVAPAVVNQVTVVPNELQIEEPYLEHNIRLTREAFNLNKIEDRSYPARTNLQRSDIDNNRETIKNVRLWDPRLLIDTYQQLQQIRTYYQFYNVDVDRYMIDGEYRQVMLAARELTQSLPQGSNTWFNRHLQYTQGYGAVANLVAREGTQGSPEFLVRDLPPVASDSSLSADNPSIYYGEQTPTYRLVSTSAQELSYPKGDENVYTSYDGDGGVLLNSFWKELLFSYYLGDYNILLSGYLTDDSRIQIWNRVQERVRRVAPFLKLDQDPYFVISDKRQYWIQDAYTTSRSFPYSEPVRGGTQFSGDKYIRNSVKIVVDAFTGDVTFYVTDPDDPILQTYMRAFPDLFQPFEAMSEDLRKHVRYPQDLFEIQIEKYRRYHMQRPQVFYNNEDLWTRPNEQYAGQQRLMEPYYILSKLPDEDRLEFMLMTPMTPENRDNMIAWIAARSDPPHYGEIITYKLPKEKLIYGPNQVESRIDQNTEISRQLSLWDQRGSQVVRGNLIVVPIEESFLYVEPIYLIAENIQIPQLRRVIVSYGEQVAMEPSLAEALNEVFGEELIEVEDQIAAAEDGAEDGAGTGGGRALSPQAAQNLQEARSLLREARQALQDGDFATFGQRFNELQEALDSVPDAQPAAPADTVTAGAEAAAGGQEGQ